MKHTQGKWVAKKLNADGFIILNEGFEIFTPEYDVVANIHQGAPIRKEADAQRIVDCVNACEGISNPKDVIKYLINTGNSKIEAIKNQRDELLEACKLVAKSIDMDKRITTEAYSKTVEAIAKAERN